MRHQVRGRHLGRTSSHRTALRRNLAASLFEHGTISTTREKAKFVKPFAERLITLAKDGSLHSRRRAISLLQDRAICKVENGEPIKVGTVIGKLFSEVGPLFANRDGGYTRIINLPLRRVGDNGRLVLLQLVKDELKAKGRSAKSSATSPSDKVTEAPAETQTPAVSQADEAPSSDIEPEGSASADTQVDAVSDETSTDKQDNAQ